ncbi:hypothetical protein BDF14DRAFT_1825807 [Spinellus fusiger]|nr:hypothetical protein BDF14DRAFT_1825807 [Spinellus fusiger]
MNSIIGLFYMIHLSMRLAKLTLPSISMWISSLYLVFITLFPQIIRSLFGENSILLLLFFSLFFFSLPDLFWSLVNFPF